VNDDLLPVEGWVAVRDDPDRPGERSADAEGLGRRAVLAAFAEGALVELGFGRLLDLSPLRAGAPPTVRGERYESP
jgi:hypothetical protein